MPTTVSLAQMVDLSLGTPEIGSVNFNVMHTLLHAIIKKLNIGDSKTEISEHDRDFLATSKIRARSTLSDADSGRGEESEDGLSEKSAPAFRPTPYHRLELKVEKLFQQMEELNQLPTNAELFDRATKSKTELGSDRPVADMWQYMQLKKRVDVNEEGVGKVNSFTAKNNGRQFLHIFVCLFSNLVALREKNMYFCFIFTANILMIKVQYRLSGSSGSQTTKRLTQI